MIRSRRKPPVNNKKFFRFNERIRSSQVVVINEAGKNVGVLTIHEALRLAQDQDLDLVEVAPNINPPVCKILDYKQFLYQQNRKIQEQKIHTKKVELKTIRLSFKIGKHDVELKQIQAKKFLDKGHKVKIEMVLKGREKQYRQNALGIISNFIKTLNINVITEQDLKVLGGQITAIIAPITKNL